MNKMRGTICLLIAALVWGVAFVAQSSAADSVETFTFNCARSFIACVFLLAAIGVRDIKSKGEPRGKAPVKGGMLCGVTLFIAANLQQAGIGAYPADAAASGRAGFLTATYVVMLALFAIITGKKIRRSILLAAAICIAGMYMLCLSGGIGSVYMGDVLVLLSAVGFTVYILTVDRFSRLDTLKMSCIQFFVCGVLSLIGMIIFEKPSINAVLAAWLPIMFAGILSNGVGYTMQMIGQKHAEPTVAAIVMSMESVIAAIAGWIILSERLSTHELIGCTFVFFAVILSQLPDFTRGRDV